MLSHRTINVRQADFKNIYSKLNFLIDNFYSNVSNAREIRSEGTRDNYYLLSWSYNESRHWYAHTG